MKENKTKKVLTEKRVRKIVQEEIKKYMQEQAKYLSLSIAPPTKHYKPAL